ncbi:MAG TPA: flagellar hook-basal body complex protein FliE [Hyphomicrobiaceae bacterium]|nr:flagellar hook-basal body complex protein FliE [Hyphomicrobiaceae bacterium]
MLNGVSSLLPATGLAGTRGPAAPAPAASAFVGVAQEAAPADFGTVLGQMALDAIGVLKSGETAAVAGVRGQMPVQQVVEAVMAAEQTLTASIAVRDKVVSAYLELSRMSI